MIRIVVSVSMWLCVVLDIAAAPPSDNKTAVVIQGVMTGPGPDNVGNSATSEMKVFLQEGAARIEFDYGASGSGVLLAPAADSDDGDEPWLISEQAGVVMPVPNAPILDDWVVDPEQPCAHMGMGARCEMTRPRMIAGVLAQGWRYRRARTRGPGGTRAGDLWVDPATGLVLGYQGRTSRRGDRRSFQAMSVSSQDKLPATLFELPEELERLEAMESEGDSPNSDEESAQ